MSADNGIYIHKFRDGYRVVHAQAIENYNTRYLIKKLFKDSPLFKTEKEAVDYAFKLFNEIDFVEYGVNNV